MTVDAKVEGLDELRAKMEAFPGVFAKGLLTTMQAVLYKVWEKVPPYPKPPPNSTYDRTGTLGRTMGVSQGGHRMGKPNILEVRQRGSQMTSASFGTNLEYAPEVIGDRQDPVHSGRWWTLRGVAVEAEKEVLKLFESFAAKCAAWLSDEGPRPT